MMVTFPEGRAVIYCEAAFGTPNGKTAHGLVRRTRRYEVLSVIDSLSAGRDAGEILDGTSRNIPIVTDLATAIETASRDERTASYFVVGLAPDGGRLGSGHREAILEGIEKGLNVDSGLHDFLTEDVKIMDLARRKKVQIRDIRKPPLRSALHFFSGKIEQVTSLKIALLGTDSAVGKRTTAWMVTDALNAKGCISELIGTGQTSWMQGVRYGIIMDSLVNDFVSGEIEHAVWSAWNDLKPDVILIEGQGSLMNPAYPGGFEILAAGRPDIIILQHAPGRKDYDGFPGYPIHPLETQIKAIELLSGKPVVAITVNHEDIAPEEIASVCETIQKQTGLPTADLLKTGSDKIINAICRHLKH